MPVLKELPRSNTYWSRRARQHQLLNARPSLRSRSAFRSPRATPCSCARTTRPAPSSPPRCGASSPSSRRRRPARTRPTASIPARSPPPREPASTSADARPQAARRRRRRSRPSWSRSATTPTRSSTPDRHGCTGRSPIPCRRRRRAAFDAAVAELRDRISRSSDGPRDATSTDQPETGTGRSHLDLARRLVAEALGTGLLDHRRRRLGDHGQPPVARRRRPAAAGERRRHRRRADRADPDVRRRVRRPLQPRRHPRRPRVRRRSPTRDAGLYIAAQIVGGCVGAVRRQPHVRAAGDRAVHQGPLVAARCGSPRSSPPSACCWSSTAACAPAGPTPSPFAVGVWIGGAYWFTSSTSFANPAVTIARTLSDTFAGIEPVVGPDVHRHAARSAPPSPSPLIRFLYPQTDDRRSTTDRGARRCPTSTASPSTSSSPSAAPPSAARASSTARSPPRRSSCSSQTSYDQFADRAKFTNFLPLMAERFARQRLRALAKVEGKARDGTPDRAVPVRAQRRSLADGARLVQPPRRRPSGRLVRRVRAGHRDQPGRRRRHGRGRHRHHRRVPQAVDRGDRAGRRRR